MSSLDLLLRFSLKKSASVDIYIFRKSSTDCVVVVSLSHVLADLSVAAVPAEERPQGQITGSHKARKTQLAGRRPPTLNQRSVTPVSPLFTPAPLGKHPHIHCCLHQTWNMHIISPCAFICLWLCGWGKGDRQSSCKSNVQRRKRKGFS